MKLTDKDAEWLAPLLTKQTIDLFDANYFDKESFDGGIVKDGVVTYQTKAGPVFVPVKGCVRVNKALDALDKFSAHYNMSALQVAVGLSEASDELLAKRLKAM